MRILKAISTFADHKTVSLQANIEKKKSLKPGTFAENVPVRKTVLIFSPDLNFSFSLSMALQERYHVVTTSNSSMLESLACTNAADIVILDTIPSIEVERQIDALKSHRPGIHVILTYVYDARDVAFDRSIRGHAEGVLYKPFEVDSILAEVEQLLVD